MIDYVKVINDLGESLTLELKNPGSSGFFVQRIEGLGPTKGTINTSKSLSIGGTIFNSVYPNSRQIIFDLGYWDTGSDSVEIARQQSYRYFPIGKQIQIEVKTENRIGYVWGYVESNEPNIFSKNSGAMISVLCPYPYVYAFDVQSVVFSGVDPNFEFPFENPSLTESLIEFGLVYINTESSVFYQGEIDTGVQIEVYFAGPVTDLAIVNIHNGDTMQISSAKVIALTGQGFEFGDRLYISTLKGNKYIWLVRNGVWTNILNALSADTSWFVIERGDNVFTFTAASGLNNVQMLIRFQHLYEGF